MFPITVSYSQNNYGKVGDYLDSLTGKDQFSGYIIIAKNGKVKFEKGFGYADKENKSEITRETQFNLSSTSKLFTGTAMAKLIQKGLVSEKDTIGKFIPSLEYGSKVTIYHLLTHSSGLSNFYDNPKASYNGVNSCKDLVKYVYDQKLRFPPGDSVFYSTTGMILLGAVIEKVSGLSYKDYLYQNFFIPLGMKNTSFVNYGYVQDKSVSGNSYAKGYIKNSEGRVQLRVKQSTDSAFVPLSAGGIWSSAGDLLLFERAIFGGKILNKAYLDSMLSPKVNTGWGDSYFGYIWININNSKSSHAVGHAGNASGHHNTFYRYTKNNTSIILLTNYGFVDIFKISQRIEDMVLK